MESNTPDEILLEEEDVINKDYLETIRKDVGVICGICQNIIMDPYSCTECQNCFCKKCIDSWIKKSNTCPFRCIGSQLSVNRVMKGVLSILKFKCKNGCGEVIDYCKVEEHYTKTCKKLNFKNMSLTLQQENKELKRAMNELIDKLNEQKKIIDKLEKENKSYKALSSTTDTGNPSNPGNPDDLSKMFFLSNYHSHTLMYSGRIYDPLTKAKKHVSWTCDICSSSHSVSEPNYHCSICDYDICVNCKEYEEKIFKSNNN